MKSLQKYKQILQISWQNGFVYRLNFIMWRVRSVIQLLVVYFLWLAIFKDGGNFAGYDKQTILTYIIGTSVLRSFVLASRSQDVGAEIATGNLNNFLVRPLNYFLSWLTRDIADKALNFSFLIGELILLFLILQPPFFMQTDLFYLSTFLLTSVLAMLLYFFLSFLISSVAFWYPEHNGWPGRFLAMVIIEFLSGGLVPLDVFPRPAAAVLQLLPPAYFLFHPLQIYLGRISYLQTWAILTSLIFWLGLLIFIAKLVWNKGLKIYGAYGR